MSVAGEEEGRVRSVAGEGEGSVMSVAGEGDGVLRRRHGNEGKEEGLAKKKAWQ